MDYTNILKNKALLERIDRISIPGTKLICIKNTEKVRKDYYNFREFAENYDKFSYKFIEGNIYEVERVKNDIITINNTEFYFVRSSTFAENVFDIFRTLSEDIALHREKNINDIIYEEKE